MIQKILNKIGIKKCNGCGKYTDGNICSSNCMKRIRFIEKFINGDKLLSYEWEFY